jgi:ankyrin repeat protein
MEGVTPLHVAARTGLRQYVQVLLKRGGTEVDARDSQGNTLLSWAASNGHDAIVQLLLQADGEPGRANDDGLKPLHQVASNNHAKIVKLLLTVGVDPVTPKTRGQYAPGAEGFRTTERNTSLMYACKNGRVNAVDAFMSFLDIPTVHQALA